MRKTKNTVVKKCSRCFEHIPFYAAKCKFCGYRFDHVPDMTWWEKIKRLLRL